MASENNNDTQCGFWASFSGSKKIKSYKWASLVLVAAFLAGGGIVAWFAMKNAADKLVGGNKYTQLNANSVPYGDGAGAKAEQEEAFFASEEELAKADSSLKDELLDAATGNAAVSPVLAAARSAAGGPASPGVAGRVGENGFSGGSGGVGRGGAAHGVGLAVKLMVREGGFGWRSGGGGDSAPAESRLERGNNGVSIQSVQSETSNPGRGAVNKTKTSVLAALKSAFKMNLYGARQSSQDAARWRIAKLFDANQDSRYSLGYDEKVKTDLDKADPNAVPKYLREQNLEAGGANSLAVSDVGKPFFDKEGTKEALELDKGYQSKKQDKAQNLAKVLFNPLGPFGGGTPATPPVDDRANPPTTDDSAMPPSTDDKASNFSDPADAQNLNDIALQDYISTNGYGAECGCTAQAPCCCMPPNAANQQCPMYGPFLPDDPCGAKQANPVGDFPAPASNGSTWG